MRWMCAAARRVIYLTTVLAPDLLNAPDAERPRRAGGGVWRCCVRKVGPMRAAPIQAAFLKRIGAPDLAPATSPFDPGYDPATLESHLEQSGHLMSRLKLSMACWLIADEAAVRRKRSEERRGGVATVTGGGPFEIAAARGQLPAYFELCAAISN